MANINFIKQAFLLENIKQAFLLEKQISIQSKFLSVFNTKSQYKFQTLHQAEKWGRGGRKGFVANNPGQMIYYS
jgi:hypothetical protein